MINVVIISILSNSLVELKHNNYYNKFESFTTRAIIICYFIYKVREEKNEWIQKTMLMLGSARFTEAPLVTNLVGRQIAIGGQTR